MGLILTSPDGIDVEYALRFGFQASNNEAEYEAVIVGHVPSLKKVRELFKKFIRVQVRHVPRAKNSLANALEKLATASREDLDRLVLVEHLPEPLVNVDNEEVSPVMSEPSWIDPI